MSSDASTTSLGPFRGFLKGETRVPGDKSISHRAILFSAMAEGVSSIAGLLDSSDVHATLQAVRQLGAEVHLENQVGGGFSATIHGWGKRGPAQTSSEIDCGNSGTTARLLFGVLAPWDIEVSISGDAYLKKRPMRRVTAPLTKMGVRFSPIGKETLPLCIQGTKNIKPLRYETPVASAQLKTAILLAGLYAEGVTTVIEPSPSRNHTELMLPGFGVATTVGDCLASVQGPCTLHASEVFVPGDPSSAAFLTCAAVLKPGSSLIIRSVSLNELRIGFVRVLEKMGADIQTHYAGAEGKEPYGDIEARYTDRLRGCEVPAHKIASLIDEIPVLALVASFAKGITVFREVSELRVKETDRLEAVVEGLGLIGVDAWVDGNDLYVEGRPDLLLDTEITFDSKGDHRLAMTWSLLALINSQPINIIGFDAINVSYPQFISDIERLLL